MIPTELSQKQRISSIDVVRGIVMVIMALDHTRDFFHYGVSLFNPTDLTKTTPVIFYTRWITHFCAPTFAFLSGVSARIGAQRKSAKELSWQLLTRGIWLIVLEQTIFRFGFTFSLTWDIWFFLVLWSIGGSMIVLSALVFISPRIILIIGLIIVFGHNAFDAIKLAPTDSGYGVWVFLMQSGFVPPGIAVPYSLIPWLGIILMGYGIGSLYTEDFDPAQRKKILFNTGVAFTLLFLILRFINVYGDPAPWEIQGNTLYTIMSFMNTTKYPVSLLFTLMILGPVMIVLSLIENSKNKIFDMVSVFGRVPLFYYIVHFIVIHSAALLLYIFIAGVSISELNFTFSEGGTGGIPRGFGYALRWTYVAWFGTVLIMYPLCKWYDRYKTTHKFWWLSYF